MSGFSFVSLLNPKLNSFSVDSKRIRLQKKKKNTRNVKYHFFLNSNEKYDSLKLCQKTKLLHLNVFKCDICLKKTNKYNKTW